MRIKSYTNKEYKCKRILIKYPAYWDEGIIFTKGLLPHKYREYKTWKHSRKTQWKSN